MWSPTRPTFVEWYEAMEQSMHEDGHWIADFIDPLIERERADAAVQERNRLRLKALELYVYDTSDAGPAYDVDAVVALFDEEGS